MNAHNLLARAFSILSVLCLAASGTCVAADIPAQPLGQKGQQILSDDFDRTDLGEWKSVIPAFTVEDGVLKGRQARADHGAVGRVYRPMNNVVAEFRFKLVGSTTFNVVFDDQNWKKSHAGHICRVSFSPNQIRLGDDKEGIMRNDIFEMRRDPARKAEAEKLIQGRTAAAKVSITPGEWHDVAIEIVGDQMRVSLNGEAVGYLKSPGLSHETKSSFHFTVTGSSVLFDDVRLWNAR